MALAPVAARPVSAVLASARFKSEPGRSLDRVLSIISAEVLKPLRGSSSRCAVVVVEHSAQTGTPMNAPASGAKGRLRAYQPVLPIARRSEACPINIMRFKHSSLIERTKRSA